MILSSLLSLLKNNVSYLELFIRNFITAIENIRFEIYFLFWGNSNIQKFLLLMHGGYLLNTIL